MIRFKKILRWILGSLLLLLGLLGLWEFIAQGYNTQNEEIMVYGDGFRNLFNALMVSYIGITIRLFHIFIGILLFTRKYWWIGLLLHLPIAFNIFVTHLLYDIPTPHTVYFMVGMFVSLSSMLLVAMEKERLKLLINP
ncbi:MAG: hypothetical protein ACTH3E_02045 [Psychroflexus halocasei]